MPDSLGDRIKRYERVFDMKAVRRMPLMVRLDGRAFHTYTRKMKKPFASDFLDAMVSSATTVAEDMQGFKAGYVQSDEATFCITDYDSLETEGWFDYRISKMVSISASLMSVAFNRALGRDSLAVFDGRAFNVPREDVVNAFLWRAKDWQRNSLQMYCQSLFSHKQLQGKKQPDMHEMLHQIGKNWTTDLLPIERNGTFLINVDGKIYERRDVLPEYASIDAAIGHLFEER